MRKSKQDDDAAVLRADAMAGLPWLTFILGTGCLDDDPANIDSTLPNQLGVIAAEISGHAILSDNSSIDQLVSAYATSLLDTKNLKPSSHDLEREVAELIARVLVCAAVASRVYRMSVLLSGRARLRETDLVPMPQREGLLAQSTLNLANDLSRELGGLRKSIVGRNLTFLDSLAKQMQDDLLGDSTDGRDSGLCAQDIDALSEVAWHLMLQTTDHYAGWGELLTALSISADELPFGMRSPFVTDLTSVSEWLTSALQKTTQDSWSSRTNTNGYRRELYQNVAATLRRQAEIHAGSSDSAEQFPVASAFVTGFDLELEMALLQQETSFVIVSPFLLHATIAGKVEVTFAWLARQVDASAGVTTPLEYLQSPDGWGIVSPSTFSELALGRPVVVRLTGSPLMQLPTDSELINDLMKALIPKYGKASSPKISHALLIDEHSGLHHWLPEVLREQAHAIPKQTFQGTDWSPRFWMLVGIQIGDNAVRQRVASLLSALPLRGASRDTDAELAHPGVAVVRASEANDRDVLHWRGIDVVRADSTELLADISNYTARLAKHENWWTAGEIAS